jgi:hypothetical protein
MPSLSALDTGGRFRKSHPAVVRQRVEEVRIGLDRARFANHGCSGELLKRKIMRSLLEMIADLKSVSGAEAIESRPRSRPTGLRINENHLV